jgi:nucleotide-binding universal stress UspA family protein
MPAGFACLQLRDMKDILVCLNGTAGDEAMLAMALRIGRSFGAHLSFIHVVPNARALLRQAMGVDMLASMLPADAIITLRARAQARAASTRDAVDTFCQRNGMRLNDASGARGDVSAEFEEAVGDPFGELLRRARFHDVVVIEAASKHGSATPQDELGRLIVEAGRPILLAPRGASSIAPLQTVSIAWRSGAEAARAVTAAMPILSQTKSVHILGAAEPLEGETRCGEDLEAVARHLGRHRIHAMPRLVAARGNACESVVRGAQELRSDLLIMGAYGHGRVRELIFGGFTQHVLDGVTLPVFLFH